MRTPTVENFKEHVRQMSEAFRIGVVYDNALRPEQASAITLHLSMLDSCLDIPSRVVHAAPILDETGYVIVMHEFGHHLAPNGYCALSKPKPGCHPRELYEYLAAKLTQEEAAWDWAQYYVTQMFPWTTAMEQVKQYGFESYQVARFTGGRAVRWQEVRR